MKNAGIISLEELINKIKHLYIGIDLNKRL